MPLQINTRKLYDQKSSHFMLFGTFLNLTCIIFVSPDLHHYDYRLWNLQSFFLPFTADSYLRHPNSYLPKYIASETDGENVPLTSGNGPSSMQRQRQIKGLDIGPHQIVESDDEDIPPYGFPSHGKRRNRRDGSDIDLVLGSGGTLVSFQRRLRTNF